MNLENSLCSILKTEMCRWIATQLNDSLLWGNTLLHHTTTHTVRLPPCQIQGKSSMNDSLNLQKQQQHFLHLKSAEDTSIFISICSNIQVIFRAREIKHKRLLHSMLCLKSLAKVNFVYVNVAHLLDLQNPFLMFFFFKDWWIPKSINHWLRCSFVYFLIHLLKCAY